MTALKKARALLRFIAKNCDGRLPVGAGACVVSATGLSKARVSVIRRELGFSRPRTGHAPRADTAMLRKLGLKPGVRACQPSKPKQPPAKVNGEVVISVKEAAAMAKATQAEMAARLDAAGISSFVSTKGERLYDIQAVQDLISIKEDHDGEESA